MLTLGRTGSGRKHGAIVGAMFLLACTMATPAPAAQTPAGTRIVNTASLSYGEIDARRTIDSNSVALRIDATLDVALVARQATQPMEPAATVQIVAFVVSNTGNARETFLLSATGERALEIAADDDGNGAFDASQDRGTTVTLDAGEGRTVFAILRDPITAPVQVRMTATATTGHGTPGTVLAGTAGFDAVVGMTGATATAETLVTLAATGPVLAKAQAIAAPDGSTRAMSGSIVTYTLEARFPGPTRDAEIADAVPVGTVFVPGSIMLDGRPQTDAVDADAASFDGQVVRVALADIAAAGTRLVRFQTKIN